MWLPHAAGSPSPGVSSSPPRSCCGQLLATDQRGGVGGGAAARCWLWGCSPRRGSRCMGRPAGRTVTDASGRDPRERADFMRELRAVPRARGWGVSSAWVWSISDGRTEGAAWDRALKCILMPELKGVVSSRKAAGRGRRLGTVRGVTRAGRGLSGSPAGAQERTSPRLASARRPRPVAGVTDCGRVSGACGAGARRPACRAGGRGRGLLRWQPWFPESAVRAGGRVASRRASAVRAGAPARGPGKWEGASPHFLSQSDAHELCPRCPHAGRPARASRVPAWSAHPAPGDRPLRSSYKSDGDVIQVERHS